MGVDSAAEPPDVRHEFRPDERLALLGIDRLLHDAQGILAVADWRPDVADHLEHHFRIAHQVELVL